MVRDMDSVAVAVKLKDKRNRVLERETNELKDELCAMRHIVHLLDNIKRVSNDCIQFLHLMVDAALRTDNTQVDQLRVDINELEDELKAWERKYQTMASIQTTPTNEHNYHSMNYNKVINNKSDDRSHANNEITNDDIDANAGADSCERFETSANDSYYDSDHNEDCAQSSSHNSLVLMPQELCEMSMETNDNDIVITSADASPQSHNQSADDCPLLPSGLQDMSSGKTLFECDWIGCDFKTNMRQRLVMHKRLHAGEMLFSCDVQGCGYQSNYKGNIKIHKKHRHRIDSDDNKEYSIHSTHSSLNNNISSTHSTLNLSHSLTKNSNFSSNLIRKRKRKKKFRLTMTRTSSVKPSANGGQLVESADTDAHSSKEDRMSALFTCNVKGCSYRSKWKQCLTAHQLLHAGVKPFKCDHPGCNYRTNFKGNVNVHKRVHRESQYQCQVNGCQFTTPWKNSFNQHQRNHLINTETTLNIDNHIEVFDDQNVENDYDYEAVDETNDDIDDEDSLGPQIPTKIMTKRGVLQTVLPVIPVQHLQKTSTKDMIANQHNSEYNTIETNAQPLVPPLIGVIKSIKSEV